MSFEVIFDIESEEYLNVLSQSHGVTVIVHHEDLSKMSSSVIQGAKHIASPNNHIDIAIEQVTRPLDFPLLSGHKHFTIFVSLL